jgi:hypothetical protein
MQTVMPDVLGPLDSEDASQQSCFAIEREEMC